MLAMISQPMGGIPEDEIYQTRLRISQKLAQLNIDVKDTLSFQSASDKNPTVYLLGRSIEAMADVDLVYFAKGWESARGCRIEYQVALAYRLPIFIE